MRCYFIALFAFFYSFHFISRAYKEWRMSEILNFYLNTDERELYLLAHFFLLLRLFRFASLLLKEFA